MSGLPILVVREMRSMARQPLSYGLRLLGAAALIAMLAFTFVEGGDTMDHGGQVFARLHATLLVAIWVLVPLFTADCISRERREQTLPMLFLTPLKPRHIVLAKGLANGLRALTLWMAVLPVLAVPFLLGGVSWAEGLLSVLLTFGSICLAMAAGLLASVRARVSMRALLLAASLGFLLFFGFALELGFLASGGGVTLPFAFARPGPADAWALFGFGLDLALDVRGCWQNLVGASLQPWLLRSGYVRPVTPLGTNLPMLINFGITAVTCLAALILLIKLAGAVLNQTWQELPPSPRVARLQRRLLTPIYFTRVFRGWMAWELNHNPIGWLERRTWSSRLVSWSWFAVFTCVYSSLLSNLNLYQNGFHVIQSFLAWMLIASIALSASRSFHRERQSGLLELLLVCPLSESQIIGGRIRALWAQFLPAVVLVLGLWLYFATFLSERREALGPVLFYASTFLTLPVIGLYQSLARSNFFSAFLATLLFGVVLPLCLARLADFADLLLWIFDQPNALSQPRPDSLSLAIPLQFLVATVCTRALYHNLLRRRFALEPR